MTAIDSARAGAPSATADARAASTRVEGRLEPLSFALWSGAVMVAAMTLPVANWTDDLGLVPVVAAVGLLLGALLVASRFTGMGATALGIGYGGVVVLWQMTRTLDPGMAWRERVLDLARRVGVYVSVVISGEPSQDALMFVLAMAIVFWAIAAFGTWWCFRRGGVWLPVLLPGVAVFLNVYYYRFGTRLQPYLPVYLLIVLALIARVELLARLRTWERRRAQIASDVVSRATQAGMLAAAVLVALTWLGLPVSDVTVEPAEGATGARPLFGDLLSDALAGLRSPVNIYGEVFGSELRLAGGRDPGEKAVFQARAGDELPAGARLYWRARVFDTYQDGRWRSALGEATDFRPRHGDLAAASHAGRREIEFTISPFLPMRLLYFPAEVVWLNRSATLRLVPDAEAVEVLEATSAETLLPGDSYRLRSRVAAPLAGDLRRAGTTYPSTLDPVYWQVPDDLPDAVRRLAAAITRGAASPYDKAVAITEWLRANIEYDRRSPSPPPSEDPIAWFLFESRVGFCDYYASAEVLMLRSIGVPSRLAAGFAQGTYDAEDGSYYVSAADSHSWPEVYFPGYGWVEFEPTLSQPPLQRLGGPSAESENQEAAAGAGQDQSGLAEGGAGGPDLADRLAGVEEIEVPEPPPHAPRVVGYTFGLAAVVVLVLLLTPAGPAAARVVVGASDRLGLRPPEPLREWATRPSSEASRVFRRLAPWPARLGVRMDQDATPAERGRAVAELVPEHAEAVDDIVDAYTAERYGSIPPASGRAARAWRRLRLHLLRAWLARLLRGSRPVDEA